MSIIHFERKKLKNGLTVIYHSDPNTPFVVVNTLYKVGSKNESHHKTGFAHLFEHLMFEGTKNIPNFDGPLQEAGGENNAFTNNDYTNYYDIVPESNVEIPFWLESDRMQYLNINSTSLKLQKKVVIEEFKENYINQPYGDIQHLLRSMTYQNHPYQWPTIGKEISHVKDATLKEVKDFYHQYYSPSNAILVIAGNIESDKAFELTEKWFSDIPEQNINISEVIQEPLQTEERLKTHIASVPENMIIIAFQMPGRLENGYFEGDLITDILSSGPSSRLQHQLVKEKKFFSEIDAYITGSVETGMFVIEGRLHNGVDIEVAKNAIWEEVKNIQENEISDIELEKVKNQMLTYMRFSDASLLNKAISLAYYELLGDAEMINEESEEYEKITKENIRDFAKKFLNISQSNTLYYLSKT
jgi:predicted Zn-dependent peptidase